MLPIVSAESFVVRDEQEVEATQHVHIAVQADPVGEAGTESELNDRHSDIHNFLIALLEHIHFKKPELQIWYLNVQRYDGQLGGIYKDHEFDRPIQKQLASFRLAILSEIKMAETEIAFYQWAV